MFCNLAMWDRVLRFVISVLLLAYAFAGGPIWFWPVGVYGLITSGWGLCPIYSFFRIRTLR
ncbi:MAG: DUF2892 domain-containing protein [Bdellovibrionaceae bacterium]|nr:DUF2892 domain-containing protein [Bdellovibrio sp.]